MFYYYKRHVQGMSILGGIGGISKIFPMGRIEGVYFFMTQSKKLFNFNLTELRLNLVKLS